MFKTFKRWISKDLIFKANIDGYAQCRAKQKAARNRDNLETLEYTVGMKVAHLPAKWADPVFGTLVEAHTDTKTGHPYGIILDAISGKRVEVSYNQYLVVTPEIIEALAALNPKQRWLLVTSGQSASAWDDTASAGKYTSFQDLLYRLEKANFIYLASGVITMSKGSGSRPMEVPCEKYRNNWDSIFGKKVVTVTKDNYVGKPLSEVPYSDVLGLKVLSRPGTNGRVTGNTHNDVYQIDDTDGDIVEITWNSGSVSRQRQYLLDSITVIAVS